MFSVVISEAVPWAGEQLQRMVCPRCAESGQQRMLNAAWNRLRCARCQYAADQYIHATPHTINTDRTLCLAGISDIHYHSLSVEALKLKNVLNTVNIRDQALVVEGRFGGWDRFPFFTTRTQPIYPTASAPRWVNHWRMPIQIVPVHDFEITVDLLVYNQWDELLTIYQGEINALGLFAEIIRQETRWLARHAARLMAEYERQSHGTARYRQLTLELAERLLRGELS